MRILMVHNRYRYRGGEDESTDLEVELLRSYGHEVDLWELDNQSLDAQNTLQTGLEAIWSVRSYKSMRARLEKQPYSLVHIQNFFPQFSPAVHYAAKRAGLPVVQTLRNYRLVCLNGFLFRDGHVCEDCLARPLPWPGVVHRCYRDSVKGSAVVANMLVVHRLLRTWQSQVDAFISLSEFARKKLIEGGLPADRTLVKPNFLHPDPGMCSQTGKYALFVGRLSSEKGLDTLFQAWERLGHTLPLKIIGSGPLDARVQQASASMRGIEYLGQRSPQEVYATMGEAYLLVLPSEWYETFGRVAIESFARGTPVVAAGLGAIAEIVADRATGLHFRPGDADDLAAKVEWAWEHPGEMAEMGNNARRDFEQKYSREPNYERLMEIYQNAIQHAQGAISS